MSITMGEAIELGLEIFPLLTYDTKKGAARRIKSNETNPRLAYGLDDFQFVEVINYDKSRSTPPDKIIGQGNGLPLRPLYINTATGMTRRAVPIDWTQGVDYVSLAQKRNR